LKNILDFYITLYELFALNGFQVVKTFADGLKADICVNGYNIAHLTNADSIEPNPYAEGVDTGTIDKLREIAKSAALSCGICTEKPYDETKTERLTDGSYKLAEVDGTALTCAHHPLLGYVFSVFDNEQPNERLHFYDLADAKQGFAVISGLVDCRQLFTEKEMTAIHNTLLKMRIMMDSEFTFDETVLLDAITSKIEGIIPALGSYDVYESVKNELAVNMSEGVDR